MDHRGDNLDAKSLILSFTFEWQTVLCRAYKLGKSRWSYNTCRLQLSNLSGTKKLQVVEAAEEHDSDRIPLRHPHKVCLTCMGKLH